ncbi:MAG: RING-HC finger protein [Candidatus Endonucleobacter bathymodioli]|uniref:RING-HC finger protein n=1 Tax=Candidatus Endonucleibacter bathymodioli TaxID=539814 RepID=A0AA90SCZ6_9GAMM|nr:RING-HC finger protein [Candidatus Endonucleobacter bathymodioli]
MSIAQYCFLFFVFCFVSTIQQGVAMLDSIDQVVSADWVEVDNNVIKIIVPIVSHNTAGVGEMVVVDGAEIPVDSLTEILSFVYGGGDNKDEDDNTELNKKISAINRADECSVRVNRLDNHENLYLVVIKRSNAECLGLFSVKVEPIKNFVCMRESLSLEKMVTFRPVEENIRGGQGETDMFDIKDNLREVLEKYRSLFSESSRYSFVLYIPCKVKEIVAHDDSCFFYAAFLFESKGMDLDESFCRLSMGDFSEDCRGTQGGKQEVSSNDALSDALYSQQVPKVSIGRSDAGEISIKCGSCDIQCKNNSSLRSVFWDFQMQHIKEKRYKYCFIDCSGKPYAYIFYMYTGDQSRDDSVKEFQEVIDNPQRLVDIIGITEKNFTAIENANKMALHFLDKETESIKVEEEARVVDEARESEVNRQLLALEVQEKIHAKNRLEQAVEEEKIQAGIRAAEKERQAGEARQAAEKARQTAEKERQAEEARQAAEKEMQAEEVRQADIRAVVEAAKQAGIRAVQAAESQAEIRRIAVADEAARRAAQNFEEQSRGATNDMESLYTYAKYSLLQGRLGSFNTWGYESTQKAKDLAEAGYFCTGKDDEVRCFCCGLGLMEWKSEDDAWREHARYMPSCFYLNQEKGEGYIAKVQREFDKWYRPKNKKFIENYTRMDTFKTWRRDVEQTPEALVDAGFYYTGENDKVCCFYCNLFLRNWCEGDDPWYAHAQYSPSCKYILQVKGGEYASNVQEDVLAREQIENREAGEHNATVENVVNAPMAALAMENMLQGDYEGNGEKCEVDKEKLRQVNKKLKEDQLCIKCKDNQREVIFTPCGHRVYCEKCSKIKLRRCPRCDKPIQSVFKTFLA